MYLHLLFYLLRVFCTLSISVCATISWWIKDLYSVLVRGVHLVCTPTASMCVCVCECICWTKVLLRLTAGWRDRNERRESSELHDIDVIRPLSAETAADYWSNNTVVVTQPTPTTASSPSRLAVVSHRYGGRNETTTARTTDRPTTCWYMTSRRTCPSPTCTQHGFIHVRCRHRMRCMRNVPVPVWMTMIIMLMMLPRFFVVNLESRKQRRATDQRL